MMGLYELSTRGGAAGMEYIALDAHKRYSFASVEEHTGAILKEARIVHRRGAIAEFLSAWKPGTPVAVETIGN